MFSLGHWQVYDHIKVKILQQPGEAAMRRCCASSAEKRESEEDAEVEA